jgi:hypothetical protein
LLAGPFRLLQLEMRVRVEGGVGPEEVAELVKTVLPGAGE